MANTTVTVVATTSQRVSQLLRLIMCLDEFNRLPYASDRRLGYDWRGNIPIVWGVHDLHAYGSQGVCLASQDIQRRIDPGQPPRRKLCRCTGTLDAELEVEVGSGTVLVTRLPPVRSEHGPSCERCRQAHASIQNSGGEKPGRW